MGCRPDAVLGGHTHELADDGHRQRQRELGHELDFPAPGQVVEEGVNEFVDGRPKPLDLTRRERPGDEAPQACVIGWVGHQHVVLSHVEELAAPAVGVAEDVHAGVFDPDAPPEPWVAQHRLALGVAVDAVGPEGGPVDPGLFAHQCVIGVRIGLSLGRDQHLQEVPVEGRAGHDAHESVPAARMRGQGYARRGNSDSRERRAAQGGR